MRARMVVLLLFTACGPRQARPAGTATGDLPAWMEGAWTSADGRAVEHWHGAGGALFGVGFPVDDVPFEAMIVSATADGKLRFTAYPAGDGGVAFEETERGAAHVTFANPGHDFPKEVGYRRAGAALAAFIGPGGGVHAADYGWQHAAATPAPELEQADRQFAADTAKSLSAGWASWFDPEGAQFHKNGRVVGPEAVRDLMHGIFDVGGLRLDWTPRASGLAPGGALGFTIGDYVATTKDGKRSTGGYVTIWRRQPDGSWKVLFDVGT